MKEQVTIDKDEHELLTKHAGWWREDIAVVIKVERCIDKLRYALRGSGITLRKNPGVSYHSIKIDDLKFKLKLIKPIRGE